MKRYHTARKCAAVESANGEWVRHEDAAKRIAELEAEVIGEKETIKRVRRKCGVIEVRLSTARQRIAELESLAAEYRKTGEQFMRDNAALKAENERLREMRNLLTDSMPIDCVEWRKDAERHRMSKELNIIKDEDERIIDTAIRNVDAARGE